MRPGEICGKKTEPQRSHGQKYRRSSGLSLLHFAFLMLFLAPLEAAKDKALPITPSFAKPVKATVFTGSDVTIPLSANAPVRGTKYLIRSLPRNGELGEIVPSEDGLATVTYRHNARLGVGTDSFTYAVQSPGAAVSSRATVAILVVNRPARIEAPAALDFGNAPVGSSSRRLVTFRNSGGETFSGRMQISSPWESELDRVEIPAGGSANIPITFSPDGIRAFSGTWFLEGTGGARINLTGSGFVVLDITPPFLSLQETKDGRRSGKLTISNKTADPVELEFVGPSAIRAIAPLVIAGGGQAEVVIESADDRKFGGRFPLVVKEKRVSATVDLLIPPAPAHIDCEPTSEVVFGTIAPGKSVSREIKIANNGGSAAAVEISVPAWIRAEPSRALIKPNEERIIRLEAIGNRPGTLRDRMVFKWDDHLSEIVVSIVVHTVSTPAAAPPTADRPDEPKHKSLHITRISQDKGFVTIGWQDPNPDPRTYRLESLQITSKASLARHNAISPDRASKKFSPEEFAAARLKFTKSFEEASKNDKVVKIWSPLEKAEIHEAGPAAFEATFPVSPDQQVLRIRLSSVLVDGSTSPVRSEIRIPLQQPPPRSWPVKTILFSLAGLLAGAFLLRNRWRNWR